MSIAVLIGTCNLMLVIPLCYLIACFRKEEQFFPLKDISHYIATDSTRRIFKTAAYFSSWVYLFSYLCDTSNNTLRKYKLVISISLFGLGKYSHKENPHKHLLFALLYFITLNTITSFYLPNTYLSSRLWLMFCLSLIIKIAKIDCLRRLISLFEWITCIICNTFLIMYSSGLHTNCSE